MSSSVIFSDKPYPKDEIVTPTSTLDPRPSSIDTTDLHERIASRSSALRAHDDIYNIRSRSKARSASRPNRGFIIGEDGDPGLHRPGDFKHRQVCVYCHLAEAGRS